MRIKDGKYKGVQKDGNIEIDTYRGTVFVENKESGMYPVDIEVKNGKVTSRMSFDFNSDERQKHRIGALIEYIIYAIIFLYLANLTIQ